MDLDQPVLDDERALDGAEGCGESLPPTGPPPVGPGRFAMVAGWLVFVALAAAVVLLARL